MARVRAYRMSRRKDLHQRAGWIKLGALTLSCLLAVGVSSLFLVNLSVGQALAMFALTWVIANFVEYSIHRWPMHMLIKGMKGIYKRHSGEHHRYFTNEYMSIETQHDMHEVFTKYRAVALLMVSIVGPVSLLFGVLVSMNAGLLFFSFSLLYYLLFEWTHFATHIPESHWVTRLPYIKGAKERHTTHHNTRLMREWNFNVSFPLCDLVFGTLKR